MGKEEAGRDGGQSRWESAVIRMRL